MVTPDKERRDRAEWSLQRIHELAANGHIAYGSITVETNIAALDYTREDVCHCLGRLTKDDFDHAERYLSERGTSPWFDVYFPRCQGPTDHIDPLYVKLRLNHDCVVIMLASFHRERGYG